MYQDVTRAVYLSLFLIAMGLSACSKEESTVRSETVSENVANKEASNTHMITKKAIAYPVGIYADAESVQPLAVGTLPKAFNVRKADGTEVLLKPSEFTKPIVLTFFRGGWCPYCNRHLAELRTVETNLKEMGFEVWFISIDKPELLYESLKEPDIGYTLFSDSELEATKTFGIGFVVDDATHEKYLGYGIDLDKASGFDHHVLPAPSTFILGVGGRVHFQYTNPDYKIRLTPEEILAAAKAYVNEH